MRPDTELPFQVMGVLQESHYLKFPVVETEKRSNGHVVQSGFQCAVQGVEPPAVISFQRIGWMHLAVGLPVIGLLKDLVGANSSLLQFFKFGNVHRGRIDVRTAYVRGLSGFGGNLLY